MWQMSSVFSHESAQRNDAGHLIDENVFKTTRSFRYQWFRVSTLQANTSKPFILSDMKHTTGGGHLEKAVGSEINDRVVLNTFSSIYIYIYIYIYIPPWNHSTHVFVFWVPADAIEWMRAHPLRTTSYTPFNNAIGEVFHWGRVTHTCVSILTTIGSDNSLSPVRRQAINWTNAGALQNRT